MVINITTMKLRVIKIARTISPMKLAGISTALLMLPVLVAVLTGGFKYKTLVYLLAFIPGILFFVGTKIIQQKYGTMDQKNDIDRLDAYKEMMKNRLNDLKGRSHFNVEYPTKDTGDDDSTPKTIN